VGIAAAAFGPRIELHLVSARRSGRRHLNFAKRPVTAQSKNHGRVSEVAIRRIAHHQNIAKIATISDSTTQSRNAIVGRSMRRSRNFPARAELNTVTRTKVFTTAKAINKSEIANVLAKSTGQSINESRLNSLIVGQIDTPVGVSKFIIAEIATP